MVGAGPWRWVPAVAIQRPLRRSSRSRLRDIVTPKRMPFEPHQYLAGFITNFAGACRRVIR